MKKLRKYKVTYEMTVVDEEHYYPQIFVDLVDADYFVGTDNNTIVFHIDSTTVALYNLEDVVKVELINDNRN